MEIISNIDTLRKYVNVNASISYEKVEPFLNYAMNVYISRYLGSQLISQLIADINAVNHNANLQALLPYVQAALAPFAMYHGTDELSIAVGEMGHTVQRDENLAPASDTKIEAYKTSIAERAWNNLELLIKYLESNDENYPSWHSSDYYNTRTSTFFKSASDYQDNGHVNINYSRLTFEKLRSILITIEDRYIAGKLPSPLYTSLQGDSLSPLLTQLLAIIKKFAAAKAAALVTSRTSKQQRKKDGDLEFTPLIRPLFEDEDSGNFYEEQAEYYMAMLDDFLVENAEELGMTINSTSMLDWNKKEKHIYFV